MVRGCQVERRRRRGLQHAFVLYGHIDGNGAKVERGRGRGLLCSLANCARAVLKHQPRRGLRLMPLYAYVYMCLTCVSSFLFSLLLLTS